MSLVKFNQRRPWGDLVTTDFFEVDDFFDNRLWNRFMSNDRYWNAKNREAAVNIKENDDNFEIKLTAPGFAKKDFEITIDDGYVNISAEKSSEEEKKDVQYTRRKFSYNTFKRSFQLPEYVKEDEVKAHYKNGILSFKLTKKEEAIKQEPKVNKVS